MLALGSGGRGVTAGMRGSGWALNGLACAPRHRLKRPLDHAHGPHVLKCHIRWPLVATEKKSYEAIDVVMLAHPRIQPGAL